MLKRLEIKQFEKGLLFKKGELKKVLSKGKYWILGLNTNVDIYSEKSPELKREDLETVLKTGKLKKFVTTADVKKYEKAFLYINGEFETVLEKGLYAFWDSFKDVVVENSDMRDPWIRASEIDVIINSGKLGEQATIIDINDNQRALVWIDGRFERILKPGQYAVWNRVKKVKVEIVETDEVLFEHFDKEAIKKSADFALTLDKIDVAEGEVGLYFLNGSYVKTLKPGTYFFWKNAGKVTIYKRDIREKSMDLNSQDIMTNDKVTLRINALITYKISDPLKTVMEVDDIDQFMYREAQLVLRGVVGTKELDVLLKEKDAVAEEMRVALTERVSTVGVSIIGLGVRDVILPGEMKTILNKVVEAKKSAEANLITRREETAAMRSQANTAKMLENNPTLMRLKELELLEKVLTDSKMTVMLGEKGLGDKIVNML